MKLLGREAPREVGCSFFESEILGVGSDLLEKMDGVLSYNPGMGAQQLYTKVKRKLWLYQSQQSCSLKINGTQGHHNGRAVATFVTNSLQFTSKNEYWFYFFLLRAAEFDLKTNMEVFLASEKNGSGFDLQALK